jgi:hypothetical protein
MRRARVRFFMPGLAEFKRFNRQPGANFSAGWRVL